jgi:hypothetical protein
VVASVVVMGGDGGSNGLRGGQGEGGEDGGEDFGAGFGDCRVRCGHGGRCIMPLWLVVRCGGRDVVTS